MMALLIRTSRVFAWMSNRHVAGLTSEGDPRMVHLLPGAAEHLAGT
jgi:hypothetical protein